MTHTFRTPTPFATYATTTYRILLDCLAHPGRIASIPDPQHLFAQLPELGNGQHANPYVVASCMTLLDQETSLVQVWNGQLLAHSHALCEWVRIRTNHIHAPLHSAMFAILWDAASYHTLSQLTQGSLTFPEQGATAFVAVDTLSNAPHQWHLQGPGIRDTQLLSIHPEPTILGHALHHCRVNYPLGVDVFVIDRHGQCAGIPRSTTIATE